MPIVHLMLDIPDDLEERLVRWELRADGSEDAAASGEGVLGSILPDGQVWTEVHKLMYPGQPVHGDEADLRGLLERHRITFNDLAKSIDALKT